MIVQRICCTATHLVFTYVLFMCCSSKWFYLWLRYLLRSLQMLSTVPARCVPCGHTSAPPGRRLCHDHGQKPALAVAPKHFPKGGASPEYMDTCGARIHGIHGIHAYIHTHTYTHTRTYSRIGMDARTHACRYACNCAGMRCNAMLCYAM